MIEPVGCAAAAYTEYVLGIHRDVHRIGVAFNAVYHYAGIMYILQRAQVAFVIRHFKGVDGLVLFNEQVVADHEFAGTAVQVVAHPCGKTIIARAGIGKRAVKIDRLHIDMPDDLALVGEEGIFTFAIEVAVIGAGVGVSFHRVYSLLKDIVHKLVAGEVQVAELDAVYSAQYLCVQGVAGQQPAQQEEVYDQYFQAQQALLLDNCT